MHEAYGQPTPRVFCTPACIVNALTIQKIFARPCVQRTIRTACEVKMMRHKGSLREKQLLHPAPRPRIDTLRPMVFTYDNDTMTELFTFKFCHNGLSLFARGHMQRHLCLVNENHVGADMGATQQRAYDREWYACGMPAKRCRMAGGKQGFQIIRNGRRLNFSTAYHE